MNNISEKANRIVQTHVLYSMGAGAIPIPLLDLTAVTAVQMDMIRQLCDLYDKDYSDVTGKALVASLTGSAFARYGASIVKAIPGIGSLLGGISMVALSGASTYAVGQVTANFLGGNVQLDNIDIDSAKKMFDEKFQEGKKVAQDLKNKAKEKATEIEEEIEEVIEKSAVVKKEDDDVYALLLKLGELRDKNIISEEEFQKKKKELLDKF